MKKRTPEYRLLFDATVSFNLSLNPHLEFDFRRLGHSVFVGDRKVGTLVQVQ